MAGVEIPPALTPPTAPPAIENGRGDAVTTFAAALRGAGIAIADAVATTRAQGTPGQWEGVAADTAGYAFSRFASDADAGCAALETAVRGVDDYAFQVEGLARRFDHLLADVSTYNLDRQVLIASAGSTPGQGAGSDGAEGEQPSASAMAQLQHEADALARRRTAILADLETLDRDVVAAEDRLIAVLAGVDTLAEGDAARDAADRVDPGPLEQRLRELQGDPKALNAWWKSLGDAEREALMLHAPELVGASDGLPITARDDANRGLLDRDLEYLHGLQDSGVELTGDQQDVLDRATAVQQALDKGAASLDPTTGLPIDTHLVLYAPEAFDGDGAGAIAYGNPDTADDTAVIVPGLTNDLGSIKGLGEDALQTYYAASGPGHTTAIVGWIGYDAPSFDGSSGLLDKLTSGANFAGVGGEDLAEAGGHRLVDFVNGLRASDLGDRSHLTVIGHSYGSTTVAHAGVDGLDEDAMVLVGSPGAGGGVDHASDLGAPPGHVYVGAAEKDPVTWLGGDTRLGLGQDPSQSSFGATRFDVAPGRDFDLGQLNSVGFQGNHTSYFDQGSTSLHNIGDIVQGKEPDAVVPGRDDPARDYLSDWAGQQAGDLWHDHVVQPLHDHVVAPIESGVESGIDHVRDGLKDLADFGSGLIP